MAGEVEGVTCGLRALLKETQRPVCIPLTVGHSNCCSSIGNTLWLLARCFFVFVFNDGRACLQSQPSVAQAGGSRFKVSLGYIAVLKAAWVA